MNHPKIVVLCGSSRFKDEYEEANTRETFSGNIVLSIGMIPDSEFSNIGQDKKKMLDQLHFRKIDAADEVLVLDTTVDVCRKCGKPCKVAVWGFTDRTDCCVHHEWDRKPYIGQSTFNEIQYAIEQGKPVRYLSRETEEKS